MKAIDLATEVEQRLNDTQVGYNITKAQLYSVTKYGEFTIANTCGDVYELLSDSESVEVASTSDFVAVLTCGWASPVSNTDDDELAPSQHPQRRRVRLFVLANRHGVASVLRFQDEPDEVVTDEGNAVGSLNDAVRELCARANAKSN